MSQHNVGEVPALHLPNDNVGPVHRGPWGARVGGLNLRALAFDFVVSQQGLTVD